jgi:sigma-54 dependent transcriptional regulator, acetoin dehydrogenase operon transcriptional activator AcoR
MPVCTRCWGQSRSSVLRFAHGDAIWNRLQRECGKHSIECTQFPMLPMGVMRLIRTQPFTGNLRQLRDLIDRLQRIAPSCRNDRQLINQARRLLEDREFARSSNALDGERFSVADAERQAIAVALRAMKFNVTHTARLLGISRPTLYAKIRKYDLNH